MDEEIKQCLKELEELQNKLDDKKFEQLRQKMNLSYEDLDKDLDKTLELLKRYQVEEKIPAFIRRSLIISNDKKLSKRFNRQSRTQN